MSARPPSGDDDGETPIERLTALGRQPAPPHLPALGQRFVDEASPRFRNFRVDLEAVQSAAVKAGKAGIIPMEDARLLFHDKGEATSFPLVRRYVEACETELIARWLAALPSFHFAGWATPRNLAALDGMVAAGEPALAVRTVRAHLKKVFDRADPKDYLRAVGGKGATDENDLNADLLHCIDEGGNE